MEVGDAGARGAVGEHFRARDVLCDRLEHGDRHRRRTRFKDAARDYGRTGSGVEMHEHVVRVSQVDTELGTQGFGVQFDCYQVAKS